MHMIAFVTLSITSFWHTCADDDFREVFWQAEFLRKLVSLSCGYQCSVSDCYLLCFLLQRWSLYTFETAPIVSLFTSIGLIVMKIKKNEFKFLLVVSVLIIVTLFYSPCRSSNEIRNKLYEDVLLTSLSISTISNPWKKYSSETEMQFAIMPMWWD